MAFTPGPSTPFLRALIGGRASVKAPTPSEIVAKRSDALARDAERTISLSASDACRRPLAASTQRRSMNLPRVVFGLIYDSTYEESVGTDYARKSKYCALVAYEYVCHVLTLVEWCVNSLNSFILYSFVISDFFQNEPKKNLKFCFEKPKKPK